MKYMLLIYSNREAYAALSAETQAQVNQDYFTYTQRIQDSGEYVAGDPLQGVDTATTVRRKDGQRTLTDGPFAETKEVLGGYYLVDVKDLDRALELAELLPGVQHEIDVIEVRPLLDMSAIMGELPWSQPSWSASSGASRGQVLATLIRFTRRLRPGRGRAAGGGGAALERWPRDGVPDRPGRLAADHRPAPGHRPHPEGGAARRQAGGGVVPGAGASRIRRPPMRRATPT